MVPAQEVFDHGPVKLTDSCDPWVMLAEPDAEQFQVVAAIFDG